MFQSMRSRSYFTTSLAPWGAFPQRLKPAIFRPRSGTAKAVPFQNRVMKQLLVLDDRREGIGLQAGAADQCAINLLLAQQSGCVVGLDAAAVENAYLLRNACSQQLRDFGADDFVGIGCHLGRGSFAGADGPDRLIGNDDGLGGVGSDAREGSSDLRLKHRRRFVGFG